MKVLGAVFLSLLLCVSSLHAADHAVVILYHHVSPDTPASTSVAPEIFRNHLEYLEAGGFNILPLGQVLKTLEEDGSVPDRTVSITFDDGYRSVLDEAMPMLKQKNWPFTVFVNTLAVDKGYRNYLGWDDIRQLMKAGAEIGNHSHGHEHLVRRQEGESEPQWKIRVAEDIRMAQQRFKEELGVIPFLFAYPYGEHTSDLREIVDALGLFGVAQTSGPVGHGFDRLAVPRFPMATNYSDMNRFASSVNSRPLPVTDVSSGPQVLVAKESSQYKLAFTILPGDFRSTLLACYSSSGEDLVLMRNEGFGGSRVSVQLPNWGPGRRKINCTAPSSGEKGVYYWFSHLWLVKHQDGRWYSE